MMRWPVAAKYFGRGQSRWRYSVKIITVRKFGRVSAVTNMAFSICSIDADNGKEGR